ncbi:selenide, water dikinase SelD [Corallincola platygyrae]|uniref:Selenide, water dikinase n=1 Tax=Corallincola platygyrae TaxID=1193278 RepID=A0ABW4XPH9_9GAMM
MEPIKLTEYSHGAGCGCKIAPAVLDQILHSQLNLPTDPKLLVGNQSKDDAAVYDLGDGRGVISTTDFFMPIVDDPFTFGRIAATNAISDVYAMGGRPLMAIAILGWPTAKLSPEIAANVVDGGRQACADAGILLAGGHSIDAPEPIFGLAVTGEVPLTQLQRNDQARSGAKLFLTKPLGIGILTTAQKQKKLLPEHEQIAPDAMCQLNKLGFELAKLPGVCAMTDVTGFGLLGHLIEICEGSGVKAQLNFDAIKTLPEVENYRAQGCIPGGTERNFASYGHKAAPLTEKQKQLLCDPQTSGGLLIAVDSEHADGVSELLAMDEMPAKPIGEIVSSAEGDSLVFIS